MDIRGQFRRVETQCRLNIRVHIRDKHHALYIFSIIFKLTIHYTIILSSSKQMTTSAVLRTCRPLCNRITQIHRTTKCRAFSTAADNNDTNKTLFASIDSLGLSMHLTIIQLVVSWSSGLNQIHASMIMQWLAHLL